MAMPVFSIIFYFNSFSPPYNGVKITKSNGGKKQVVRRSFNHLHK